jgi:hypothetical protein
MTVKKFCGTGPVYDGPLNVETNETIQFEKRLQLPVAGFINIL